jgi:hypothetical protein
VVELLRSPVGRLSFTSLSLLAGAGLVLLGRTGYAAVAAVFAFLFLTDELSNRAWDRLHARLAERPEEATEPARALAPRRVSTTTKVVVLVGTLLFAWLVLVSALVALVAR